MNAIIGDDTSVTGGLLGAATLRVVNCLVVRFLYYSHATLDRLVEGDADVLIENDRTRLDRLEKELIALPELQAVMHRQGFASLDEVERAVIVPAGTISFIAKQPSPPRGRHASRSDHAGAGRVAGLALHRLVRGQPTPIGDSSGRRGGADPGVAVLSHRRLQPRSGVGLARQKRQALGPRSGSIAPGERPFTGGPAASSGPSDRVLRPGWPARHGCCILQHQC